MSFLSLFFSFLFDNQKQIQQKFLSVLLKLGGNILLNDESKTPSSCNFSSSSSPSLSFEQKNRKDFFFAFFEQFSDLSSWCFLHSDEWQKIGFFSFCSISHVTTKICFCLSFYSATYFVGLSTCLFLLYQVKFETAFMIFEDFLDLTTRQLHASIF